MRTAVYESRLSLSHRVPVGHPEHPGRHAAIKAALADLPGLGWREPAPGHIDQVRRFHTPDHVDRILHALPEFGPDVQLDADTHLSTDSPAAGLMAVGSACAAVDAVMAGELDAGFILARPPGHHAEPSRPMGFCLFNTIACAALHALDVQGLERVAIVDIDVHHGNGTQCLAERDERVLFASLHQAPLYPGTGSPGETGLNGNVVNVQLREGLSGLAWRGAFEAGIIPALKAFKPEFLFVSAGFDAHVDDPLAGLQLRDADYAWAGERLAGLAKECASSRLVSVLEGGYDCDALGRSVRSYLTAIEAV